MKVNTVKYLIYLLYVFSGYAITAQTTISNGGKPIDTKDNTFASGKHKILVIPYEPRMYMSQIDHKINAETKMDQKKINSSFRQGLDDELYKSLKKKMEVITFLDDTSKYKKDLVKTYEHTGYKFDKIPDQNKYQAPKNEKENKFVQKGQLVADTDNEGRFMNTTLKDNTLLPSFHSKFQTDVFLFINQFEIITTMDPSGLSMNSTRTITVHYTVFTKDGKEINSGVSKVDFPQDVNNPQKISSKYISKIAEEIATRIEKALTPVKK